LPTPGVNISKGLIGFKDGKADGAELCDGTEVGEDTIPLAKTGLSKYIKNIINKTKSFLIKIYCLSLGNIP
jgi:hypothetical protein